MPNPTQVVSAKIGKYDVRLYDDKGDGKAFSLIYSYDRTRLEVLEYDNGDKARNDFRLVVSVITNVLTCEGVKV